MQKPKRRTVFEERIKAAVTEEQASQVGERTAATFLFGACHAGSVDPKPNRAHHVLAHAKGDHGLLVIGKERGISVQPPDGLGKPGVAARKGLVAGDTVILLRHHAQLCCGSVLHHNYCLRVTAYRSACPCPRVKLRQRSWKSKVTRWRLSI